LASIIEKRRCLHKDLAGRQQENDTLKHQISRLQALANIGVNTCMIAHELNNLLTPAANYANLALENPEDKALTNKALRKMVKNCSGAAKIMESMLAIANGETQEKKNTNLKILVEEIFSCLCRDFGKDGITVRVEIPENVTVWVVPVQLQQVIMNLILNAREAMLPHGGILTVDAKEVGDSIQIEVTDTGCGIAAADLDKIFEPFFTTRAAGKSSDQGGGFGIGLAFCRKAISENGGSISVESQPSKGAKFTITIPNKG